MGETVHRPRSRAGNSSRGRRQQPVTDTDTYQDSKCLSRLILSTWAWHPLCPISRSSDVVPVEFGSEHASDIEAIEDYKSFFQPFIVEEALASVLKEAEDEVRDKQSMQIRFRGITDVGEGRADVSCVLVNNRKKNVGRKLKEGNLVFLFNFDPCTAKIGLREMFSRCQRRDSTKVAVFAGWIKFCGRIESDGLHLEVQHARSPGSSERDEKHALSPHPGDLLSSTLLTALDDSGPHETGKWYLVSCSSPVTSQREMASLEAMSRREDVQMLIRPSLFLQGQGGVAHRIWPEQLGFKPYIDYIKQCHDITQLEAVEACAALCASPLQVTKFLSKKPSEKPALLPVILIQGPPGTGKTHTVKTVLNSWHLCQFQRFNDAQYQRLCALLKERKAATSNTTSTALKSFTAGGYKRPRTGDGAGTSEDPSSVLAATRREVDVAATSAAAAEQLAMAVATGSDKAAIVPRPRILVCAPSNAAVDELLKRVLEARFVDVHGRPYKPRVVRIGSETAVMSDSARKVWVDKIVADMLDNTTTDQANKKILATESQQRSAVEQRTLAIQRLSFEGISPDDHKQTVSDYISAENTFAQLSNEHDMWTTVHAYLNNATSRWDAEEMLAAAHMESAEIVFTTLSSTGRRAFERGRRFDLVLIDEAAQASEAATLQPLTLGSGKLVLVGDPRQLPATILSKQNQRLAFDRSLFQRLMDAGWPVSMLSVQYRMHPHIRRFPGKHFYNDELKDGHSVTARPMMQFYAHDLFKPYVVYDVSHGRDRTASAGSGSRWNLDEINMALALFQELRQYLVSLMQKSAKEGTPRPQPCTVGIITPYREQCRRMKQAFEEVLGESVAKEVKIDTVDSFQGKQMDVIIMSCVRASGVDRSNSSNARALLGFVEDVRRMNVGITRARHALWLLGNAKTLSVNEHWRALFEDARTYIKGGCVIEDADAEQLFPEAKLWDPNKPSRRQNSPEEPRGAAEGAAEPGGNPNANGASQPPHAQIVGGVSGNPVMQSHAHSQMVMPQMTGGVRGGGIPGFHMGMGVIQAQHAGVVGSSNDMFQNSSAAQAGTQATTTHIGGVHLKTEPQQQQQQMGTMHVKLEMKLPDLTGQRQGAGAAVFSGGGRPAGGMFGVPAVSRVASGSGMHGGGTAGGAGGSVGTTGATPTDGGSNRGSGEGAQQPATGGVVPKALSLDPRRRGAAEESLAKDPRLKARGVAPGPPRVSPGGTHAAPLMGQQSAAKVRKIEVDTHEVSAVASGAQSRGAEGGGQGAGVQTPMQVAMSAMQHDIAGGASGQGRAQAMHGGPASAAAAAARVSMEAPSGHMEDELEDDIVSARGTGANKLAGDKLAGQAQGQGQSSNNKNSHIPHAAPKTSASASAQNTSGSQKGSGAWPTSAGSRAPPPDWHAPQHSKLAAPQDWTPAKQPPPQRPADSFPPPSASPQLAAPPDIALQHAQHAQHTQRAAPAASNVTGTSKPPPDLLHAPTAQLKTSSFGSHAPPDLVMQSGWGSRQTPPKPPPTSTPPPGPAFPSHVAPRHSNAVSSQTHLAHAHAQARPLVPQTQTQHSSPADDFVDVADLKRPRSAIENGPQTLQSRSMHAGHARSGGPPIQTSSKPPPWVTSVAGPTGGRQYGGRSTHGAGGGTQPCTETQRPPHAYNHALPPDVQASGSGGGGFSSRGSTPPALQHDDEDIAAQRKAHKPPPPQGGHAPFPPPMAPKPHPPSGGGGLGMPPPPDLLHLK